MASRSWDVELIGRPYLILNGSMIVFMTVRPRGLTSLFAAIISNRLPARMKRGDQNGPARGLDPQP